jgi:hypothetical protein
MFSKEVRVEDLAPNFVTSEEIRVDGLPPGEYTLRYILDSDDEIDECNEDDNIDEDALSLPFDPPIVAPGG